MTEDEWNKKPWKERIEYVLKKHNLSKQNLADRLGVCISVIKYWLSEKRAPNEKLANRIKFLCVDKYFEHMKEDAYMMLTSMSVDQSSTLLDMAACTKDILFAQTAAYSIAVKLSTLLQSIKNTDDIFHIEINSIFNYPAVISINVKTQHFLKSKKDVLITISQPSGKQASFTVTVALRKNNIETNKFGFLVSDLALVKVADRIENFLT